jgi:hypothetical protein
MKRYGVGYKGDYGFFCHGYGKEDEHGEWVRAEDAAELEKQLAEARAVLKDVLTLGHPHGMTFVEFYRKHATTLKAAR